MHRLATFETEAVAVRQVPPADEPDGALEKAAGVSQPGDDHTPLAFETDKVRRWGVEPSHRGIQVSAESAGMRCRLAHRPADGVRMKYTSSPSGI